MANEAKSYFGRGVKFNGVDQAVENVGQVISDINNCSIAFMIGEDFGVTGRVFYSGHHFKIKLTSSNRIIVNYQDSIDGWVDHNFTLLETANLVFNISSDTIKVYINSIESYTYSHNGILSQGLLPDIANENGVSFASVTLKDMYVFNDILTPTQIKYQYEYPEKFLYREDDVLKSQILSQAEIDNVVAYLPMCETDDYVRDLANYSEGNELFDTFNAHTSGGVITLANRVYNIVQTTSSGNSLFPYVKPASSMAISNTSDLYLHEFTVDIISGTALLNRVVSGYHSDTLVLNKTMTIGDTYTFYAVNTYRGFMPYLAFNGVSQPTFEANVTMSMKQLQGTYPITNPTASCRDDAKNLSTGLQTSKWKRDTLGVPYASSFDRLECDGVGYLDTGWIPPNDSDWAIECIIEMPLVATGAYGKYFGSSGDILVEQRNTVADSLKIKVWDTAVVPTGLTDSFYHILMLSNGKIYLNGLLIRDILPTKTVLTNSIYLGGRNISGTAVQFVSDDNRLFKVHNKAMTPQEVKYRYDQAVTAGLLN